MFVFVCKCKCVATTTGDIGLPSINGGLTYNVIWRCNYALLEHVFKFAMLIIILNFKHRHFYIKYQCKICEFIPTPCTFEKNEIWVSYLSMSTCFLSLPVLFTSYKSDIMVFVIVRIDPQPLCLPMRFTRQLMSLIHTVALKSNMANFMPSRPGYLTHVPFRPNVCSFFRVQ